MLPDQLKNLTTHFEIYTSQPSMYTVEKQNGQRAPKAKISEKRTQSMHTRNFWLMLLVNLLMFVSGQKLAGTS